MPGMFSAAAVPAMSPTNTVSEHHHALFLMIFSRGSIVFLVTMYAINVFITFSLSQYGMARFYYKNRETEMNWKQHIPIHIIGFMLCITILLVTIYEKIGEGGWFTLFLTISLVCLCFLIHSHYQKVTKGLRKLDTLLEVDDSKLWPKIPVRFGRKVEPARLANRLHHHVVVLVFADGDFRVGDIGDGCQDVV